MTVTKYAFTSMAAVLTSETSGRKRRTDHQTAGRPVRTLRIGRLSMSVDVSPTKRNDLGERFHEAWQSPDFQWWFATFREEVLRTMNR